MYIVKIQLYIIKQAACACNIQISYTANYKNAKKKSRNYMELSDIFAVFF